MHNMAINVIPSVSQETLWAAEAVEESDDVDEPPEPSIYASATKNDFERTAVRQPAPKSSLLTQAIMGQSDEDLATTHHKLSLPTRRRSITSTISLASSADLTSDTGFTSPARTSTPSPPIPDIDVLRIADVSKPNPPCTILGAPDPACKAVLSTQQPLTGATTLDSTVPPPRKRCIQFACGKPAPQTQVVSEAHVRPKPEASRPSCIKFACATRPSATPITPLKTARPTSSAPRSPGFSRRVESPSTPKKASALAVALAAAAQQQSPRRPSDKQVSIRPKFLRANSQDLVKDSSQFHEFAIGVTREHDWIRLEQTDGDRKLTIDDTLTKENAIRKLAREAEEEAELEDEQEEANLDGEDDEEDEDMNNDDEDAFDERDHDEEEEEDYEREELDGYSTDEESGFELSDDEDEDDNMVLWTPRSKVPYRSIIDTPTLGQQSAMDQFSDSSLNDSSAGSVRRSKARRVPPQSSNFDLPDSTDFVCGTLDEDRPLEEAYLTNLAARRNEKLRVIPQDIDPSFPTSEPEDEDDEDIYNPVHHSSDEDQDWITGKMEDIHQENGRSRRRKRSEHVSPRKYRSPAPKVVAKRHFSPPPKGRCRSPRRLFDHHSPRKLQSTTSQKLNTITPRGSPRHGRRVDFQLAGRPGLTDTKSLPRPAALFPHMRHKSVAKVSHKKDGHVRSAIDIVKGLERKRQRRKEKFHQKYCDRARRGQIPERKQKPGIGAERMKELGLLMAGKKDQGNYVLSV